MNTIFCLGLENTKDSQNTEYENLILKMTHVRSKYKKHLKHGTKEDILKSLKEKKFGLGIRAWHNFISYSKDVEQFDIDAFSRLQDDIENFLEKKLKQKVYSLQKKEHEIEHLVKENDEILEQISGYKARLEFIKYVKEVLRHDTEAQNRILFFYEELVKGIVSYRISSCAISMEEVSGDNSMLNSGRETLLAYGETKI